MNEDLTALLPEIALAGAAVLGLLAGAWLPRHRQWPVPALALLACLFGLVATGAAMAADQDRTVFGAAFAVDDVTNAGRLIVLGALLPVLALGLPATRGHPRRSEFHVLILLSGAGTLALVGADDLLMLFSAYLLASIPAYALAGFRKDAFGTEAALKYYLMGALFGVVMLTGVTVLYGATRTVAYADLDTALAGAPRTAVALGVVTVVAGLLFKIGGAPAHFWVPDVTDGTPPEVAAFVTTVPKIGGLVALYRFAAEALPQANVDVPLLIAVLAALSMTLGNLAAFPQTSVQRLLGYSTISQVGYLLMAVAVAGRSGQAQESLFFYLAAYALTNLAAFAVVAALPGMRLIADYRGAGRRHPGLVAVLVVCLLGFVGTPPTGVFVGKVEVFTAAIDGGYTWLAVVATVNTVASLFYYLRWLAPAVFGHGTAPAVATPAGPALPAVTAYVAGGAALLIGLVSGVVLPFGRGGTPG